MVAAETGRRSSFATSPYNARNGSFPHNNLDCLQLRRRGNSYLGDDKMTQGIVHVAASDTSRAATACDSCNDNCCAAARDLIHPSANLPHSTATINLWKPALASGPYPTNPYLLRLDGGCGLNTLWEHVPGRRSVWKEKRESDPHGWVWAFLGGGLFLSSVLACPAVWLLRNLLFFPSPLFLSF